MKRRGLRRAGARCYTRCRSSPNAPSSGDGGASFRISSRGSWSSAPTPRAATSAGMALRNGSGRSGVDGLPALDGDGRFGVDERRFDLFVEASGTSSAAARNVARRLSGTTTAAAECEVASSRARPRSTRQCSNQVDCCEESATRSAGLGADLRRGAAGSAPSTRWGTPPRRRRCRKPESSSRAAVRTKGP